MQLQLKKILMHIMQILGWNKIGGKYLRITWYALFMRSTSISHSQIHSGEINVHLC